MSSELDYYDVMALWALGVAALFVLAALWNIIESLVSIQQLILVVSLLIAIIVVPIAMGIVAYQIALISAEILWG